jgi:hypothetical protein
MMRYSSDLYLTATLSVLIVSMLLLGAILVRNSGSATKGGQFVTVSEHGKDRAYVIPRSGDQVTRDIDIADLRGTLP